MPHLILVGGPPFSGKTTLAQTLSDQWGYPVVSADQVFDQLPLSPVFTLAEIRDETGNAGTPWPRNAGPR